jgi:hypothetical protein
MSWSFVVQLSRASVSVISYGVCTFPLLLDLKESIGAWPINFALAFPSIVQRRGVMP